VCLLYYCLYHIYTLITIHITIHLTIHLTIRFAQVQLTYEDMSWLTATVQNNLFPIFNETFRVPLGTLPTKGDPTKQMVLQVMDEDDYLGVKTDFLGKVMHIMRCVYIGMSWC
jgi:hypothetical protein